MLKIITKCKKGSYEFEALEWFLKNFLNVGDIQKSLQTLDKISHHECHAEINVCSSYPGYFALYSTVNKLGKKKELRFLLPVNYETYVEETYGDKKDSH